MTRENPNTQTAAAHLLYQMKRGGIDHLLANPGTDFPSIIEALSADAASGAMPKALAIHHENVAVGMAHGYYLVSGKMAAVMVHVNVGLANCTMGALNAASSQVPVLLMSGRSPVTEVGRHGSRQTPIHWGQEMFNQASLVQESTKWTYELRYPEQAAHVVQRAISIAQAQPSAPVYVSLPREVLAETVAHPLPTPVAPTSWGAAPNPQAIQEAALRLAKAQRPVVVLQRTPAMGRIDELAALLDETGWGVVEFWPTTNTLSTHHASHLGFEPAAVLAQADAVLTIGAMVPWTPLLAEPTDAFVVAVGWDPLDQATPYRGFRADLCITGDPAQAIAALRAAVRPQLDAAQVAARQRWLADTRQAQREALSKAWQEADHGVMNPAFVSRVLSEEVGEDAAIFCELGPVPGAMHIAGAGQLHWTPLAGGLGWGLPAALGAKLARPERTVIAAVGDGSYLFANPSACHQVSITHDLPVLTVLFNNGRWQAVKRATLSMYPDGEAAALAPMPLTDLGPAPDYTALARAHGAYTEQVSQPSALREALQRALHEVRQQGRQALVEVLLP